MLEHGPKEAPYNHASILGALVYAHSVLGSRIEPFIKAYASGKNLSPGNPALALRVYVAERMGRPLERDRAPHLKALRSVNAYLEREPTDRLQVSEHGYRYLRALEAAKAAPSAATAA